MGSRNRHTTLVLVLLYLVYAPRWALSPSFNLNFSDPGASSWITFAGDAFPTASMLELTRNTHERAINESVGRAWYSYKVPLWSNATGEMASFTTTFSFQIIQAQSLELTGDGMAFFLGHFPSAVVPESQGGSLGLLPDPAFANGIDDSRIVAVEFDSFLNAIYDDINVNHVGIDVNSIKSTASTDTTTWPGKNLTSSIVMEATVTYHNESKMLAVDLLIGDALYQVNAIVDLRRHLPEQVAIGFSAANGVLVGLHRILSWSFSSTLELSSPLQTSKNADRDGLERGVAASGPKRYKYRDLVAATSNFAEEEKLGRGGFGGVYRGHLTQLAAAVGGQQDHRAVAVKVLSTESSEQGRREFEAEVKVISMLKHRNLAQLLGWCDSRKGLLLVYELVTEGSLDKHLYSKDKCLTWPQRYEIILGLGSALHYLHREGVQCVVHGDIKPSNIMLDSSHSSKLGDFGLARLIDHDTGLFQTTKAVQGTVGYIDPEFVNTGRRSTESDVYSFGVVLLEIVCGRPPVVETAGKTFSLLRWVWGLYSRGAILDAADPRLKGVEANEWWMERVLVIGLWCAFPYRSERPSVMQAMHFLQSEEATLPELPQHMYRAVRPDLALCNRQGDYSIDDGPRPGCVGSSSANIGNTILSAESSSTALLRHSKFPTV
ncbi:hypothetical protein CFC21_111592 [Triticum aestivum]|uniref:non-specific serine/threonine protein kinase n=2 Tax=Triticum aestivum TaxID=4565 RepID=A0A9R1MQH6_WHEAT|nr:L-type lectin-domain containing receptor kinase IX.1-like [Triticum aestivum]KAF7111602.1 hypothetical protein CFC21_111592 [Triticum aestivum]